MKNLIVTADDCGLSRGINLATVELHQKGIVTDASVMTNFPAAAHALEIFARYPQLKVGAHLNLTDGFPLTGFSGRAQFPPTLESLARLSSASFRAGVEEELDGQIRVMTDAGLQPKHLSTHLQFHLIPALREIVARLAAKYRIPWIRPHRLDSTIVPFNPFLKKRNAPSQNDDAHSGERPAYIAVLKYWLHASPEKFWATLDQFDLCIEIVVHPCLAADETFPDGVNHTPEARFRETRYLERLWLLLR